MASQQDSIIAAWLTAIERWREARRALGEWRTTNPYPSADLSRQDHDEAAGALSRWEQGNDRFAPAYGDAVDALVSLPAPNMDAVIVKLQLAREALAEGLEDSVAPIVEAVEWDLRRLSDEQNQPN
ncbi:hypothetical protein [Sphingobium yanoikuyae]|uniref:hypothetical protein n=1 Tax=Sphingobium yanoikuyae TaxID=13690 RepID=UPI0028DBDF14|nr:hypothetical protein [Sphingobium yanoikuyae]